MEALTQQKTGIFQATLKHGVRGLKLSDAAKQRIKDDLNQKVEFEILKQLPYNEKPIVQFIRKDCKFINQNFCYQIDACLFVAYLFLDDCEVGDYCYYDENEYEEQIKSFNTYDNPPQSFTKVIYKWGDEKFTFWKRIS